MGNESTAQTDGISSGTFWAEIELGRDTMQTTEDLADALERIGALLREGPGELHRTHGMVGDREATIVGFFSVDVSYRWVRRGDSD